MPRRKQAKNTETSMTTSRQQDMDELCEEVKLLIQQKAEKEQRRVEREAHNRAQVENLKKQNLEEQAAFMFDNKKKKGCSKSENENSSKVEDEDDGNKNDASLTLDYDPLVKQSWKSKQVQNNDYDDSIWDETVDQQKCYSSYVSEDAKMQRSSKNKNEVMKESFGVPQRGVTYKRSERIERRQRQDNMPAYKPPIEFSQKACGRMTKAERRATWDSDYSAIDDIVDASAPKVNVWESRKEKMEAVAQMEPHTSYEETVMLMKAIELSKQQTLADEKRRRDINEEYQLQQQLMEEHPELLNYVDQIEENCPDISQEKEDLKERRMSYRSQTSSSLTPVSFESQELSSYCNGARPKCRPSTSTDRNETNPTKSLEASNQNANYYPDEIWDDCVQDEILNNNEYKNTEIEETDDDENKCDNDLYVENAKSESKSFDEDNGDNNGFNEVQEEVFSNTIDHLTDDPIDSSATVKEHSIPAFGYSVKSEQDTDVSDRDDDNEVVKSSLSENLDHREGNRSDVNSHVNDIASQRYSTYHEAVIDHDTLNHAIEAKIFSSGSNVRCEGKKSAHENYVGATGLRDRDFCELSQESSAMKKNRKVSTKIQDVEENFDLRQDNNDKVITFESQCPILSPTDPKYDYTTVGVVGKAKSVIFDNNNNDESKEIDEKSFSSGAYTSLSFVKKWIDSTGSIDSNCTKHYDVSENFPNAPSSHSIENPDAFNPILRSDVAERPSAISLAEHYMNEPDSTNNMSIQPPVEIGSIREPNDCFYGVTSNDINQNVLRNCQDCQQIPISTQNCQQIPISTQNFQQIPISTQNFQQIPISTQNYQQIPISTQNCQQIPVSNVHFNPALTSSNLMPMPNAPYYVNNIAMLSPLQLYETALMTNSYLAKQMLLSQQLSYPMRFCTPQMPIVPPPPHMIRAAQPMPFNGVAFNPSLQERLLPANHMQPNIPGIPPPHLNHGHENLHSGIPETFSWAAPPGLSRSSIPSPIPCSNEEPYAVIENNRHWQSDMNASIPPPKPASSENLRQPKQSFNELRPAMQQRSMKHAAEHFSNQ